MSRPQRPLSDCGRGLDGKARRRGATAFRRRVPPRGVDVRAERVDRLHDEVAHWSAGVKRSSRPSERPKPGRSIARTWNWRTSPTPHRSKCKDALRPWAEEHDPLAAAAAPRRIGSSAHRSSATRPSNGGRSGIAASVATLLIVLLRMTRAVRPAPLSRQLDSREVDGDHKWLAQRTAVSLAADRSGGASGT